jgi:hypothetical protein
LSDKRGWVGSLVNCLIVGCLRGCRVRLIVLSEFGSEGRYFGEEEFTFDTSGVCVVEYCPNGYLISALVSASRRS